jgi:hypothetical protein
MGLSGAAIGTYRPQYRPLSAIRYLNANSLPTHYMLFITLATATYCPSCPGMQADTRAIHLPSPATRDAFFVRVHGAAFQREEANNGCGPILIKSWRLSLHPTTCCLNAASNFCQSRPPWLMQETLRDCEATASHDVDEQCIRGS